MSIDQRARDLEQVAIDQRRLADKYKHLGMPALSMRASGIAQEVELLAKVLRSSVA